MKSGSCSITSRVRIRTLLRSFVSCEASSFGDSNSMSGYLQVLRAVEDYFLSGVATSPADQKVNSTLLPPIYFQYPGMYSIRLLR